ncbi:MAG: ABC transporter substrate-binding protein, partial [Clostridia bacterium]|nr:ABC transporter substrate-binding protein [Clostridia bacterium]
LMGGAFESGTGDFVTLFEPTASSFEAQGKGHIVTNLGLESGEVPYTTFMMRQETIAEDPEFAEAFVRAVYKAQRWVWSATDEEVAVAMQDYFPDTSLDDLATVAKSYRATDSWTKVPTMTEDAFTRLQDIMDGAGELSARVALEELVDNSIAEKVMAEVD